jgi:phosphate-selective porin OprO/OprP
MILLLTVPAAAQNSTSEPAARDPKKTEAPDGWAFTWANHPSLQFGDVLRVDFRARFQGDVRGSDASLDGSDTSGLDMARRRVGISGSLGDVAEFQVEHELAGGDGWRDVFVNYRGLGALEFQAGKFKVPFGLDENTSSSDLDFVYRSRAATQLAPGRDQGVMLHGRTGIVRYAWGAFAHDGGNMRTPGHTREAGAGSGWAGRATAGRLVVQPFRSSKSVFEDLQAGIAYTATDAPASMVDLRADTALGQSYFPSPLAVQGPRRRIGLEVRWRPGPFSVQSEFIRLTSERQGQSISDGDLPGLVESAWYTQGTWIVTGEHKRKGAADSKRPLFDGGIGSIELAARVEAVRLHSGAGGQPSTGPRAETILPHGDRVVTLGVNWWPHPRIRIQANLIRDTLSLPAGDAPQAGSTYWSRVLRLGFSL